MGNKKTIFLVGGGSGGHAMPVLAVFEKLKKANSGLEIKVIGGGTDLEDKIFGHLGDNYIQLKAGKFHRYEKLKNIAEIPKFGTSFLKAMALFKQYRPDLIFSKGGFVSMPIIHAARVFRVPYFIHESDIEMGRSNRMAVHKAKRIFTGFPLENYKFLDERKSLYVGQILREEFVLNNLKNKKAFGFSGSKPVIFITGGSQGSVAINNAVSEVVSLLLDKYCLIHQTGELGYDALLDRKNKLADELKNSWFLEKFLSPKGNRDMMALAINTADLVISRVGANTIAELLSKKKPLILIPYQHAAGDHQSKNAAYLEEKGAAVVIKQEELSSKFLLHTIYDLFSNNEAGLKQLSASIEKLAFQNGLEIVCNEIEKELKQ